MTNDFRLDIHQFGSKTVENHMIFIVRFDVQLDSRLSWMPSFHFSAPLEGLGVESGHLRTAVVRPSHRPVKAMS